MDAKSMSKRSEEGMRRIEEEKLEQAELEREELRKRKADAERIGSEHEYSSCQKYMQDAADKGLRTYTHSVSAYDGRFDTGIAARALRDKLKSEGYKCEITGSRSETANMGDFAAPCMVDIDSVYVTVSW